MKTGKRVLSLLLVAALLLSTSVAVFAEAVLAIDIATLPAKLTYTEWEALDVTGGELTVYYSGSQEVIPITEDMVTGFDSNVLGTQTLTVSYAGAVCTYDVLITPKPASAIAVTTLPTKLTYLEGKDTLDVTGGELTVSYADGTPSKTIPMTLDMVTGFDNTSVGTQTLTVSYAEQTTTFQVDVFEADVVSISIAKLPDSTRFLLNFDDLDVTGGEIIVCFNNDTTATIPMTAEMVSGFDNTILGEQSLTVTYEEKTTEFTVEICQNNTVEFFSGLGTVNRPYIIKTKDHLDHVRNYLDAHYMMIADIEFTEADFAEDGAFYNSGKGWQPIGTDSAPFNGYFDGNGHTIKGLQINIFGSSTVYAGLFGYVKNCTIRNLGMVDSCIKGTSTSNSSYAYAGGIVGYASNSTITNCYNAGSVTVTVSASDSRAYAGGIVGGATSNTTITNCYNTGSVTAPVSASYSRAYTGGIVGYAYSSSTIANCYNTGCVTATSYAGGIVGYAYSSSISDCYYLNIIAKGVGSGTDTATACTAEQMKQQATFVGFDFETVWTMDADAEYPLPTLRELAHVEIEDTVNFAGGNGSFVNPYQIATKEQLNNVRNHPGCFFKLVADITFTEEDFAEDGAFYNGGAGWEPIGTSSAPFYGYFDGDGHTIKGVQINISSDGTAYAGPFGYVKNCTIRNLSILDSCIEVTSTSVSPYAYAGGIVGYAYSSSITDCYNSGSITVSATASSTYAYAYAGSIVGYAYSSTITNCYNTGSVTATASSSFVSCAYAGGIVGYTSGSTINDCYNTGSVTATSVSSHARAGGVVGYVYSGSTTTITNCYNTGSVSASGDVGGIVGETESSTITNCYYLNIIGKGVGRGTDTATACTVEQMKQQETFAGFDFDTVWTMEGHEDFLFPELQTVPMVFTDGVVDVSIETLPDKLTFEEGIPLDTSGGMLKVSYLGGKVIEVPLEVSMVTGFDYSVPGEQILTVTYEGKTTTFTVTVTHSYETEWSQDETYHWHACSACGDKTDYAEHVYDNACDTTCNVCGYTRTITHSFGNWAVTEEPTCTEKGEETRTCAICGKTETREVEALGHDYKATVTDPTCTEQGYTTHTCSRCDDSYVDTYVEALGHDFGEWTETKAATCTEKGEERRDCSRCEHYETREVEALGHDYKDTVTDPTCTEQGYTTHTCSRCDDSYVDTYVEALGHDFGV